MIKNTKIKSILLAASFTYLDVLLLKALFCAVDCGIILYSRYKNLHINVQLINIFENCITLVCGVVLFIKKLKKYLARTEAEWKQKSY